MNLCAMNITSNDHAGVFCVFKSGPKFCISCKSRRHVARDITNMTHLATSYCPPDGMELRAQAAKK